MKKKVFTLLLCLLTAVTASANVAYDEVCFAGHSLALLGTNWTKDLSDWSSGNDHLSGTAQWDYATKTLTLTDVMINRVNFGFFASEKVCMWIETMQEVNVAIKGDCQLWSQKGTPLQLYGDVALTGNGTLSLVGSDADIEFKAKRQDADR